MSFNATTLSAAIGTNDTSFVVASATGITAPNFTTGVGLTYLLLETEYMLVTGVSGTTISVQRGVGGSPASAHVNATTVLAGLPSDFGPLVPSIKAQQDPSPSGQLYGMGATIASAATIAAPSAIFHVSGTTAINIITPPTGMVEGAITIIFDGVCPWTSSAVANGLAATGTSTTAKSAVVFYLDAGTALWYPSRLA